jgi:hypothetical protein
VFYELPNYAIVPETGTRQPGKGLSVRAPNVQVKTRLTSDLLSRATGETFADATDAVFALLENRNFGHGT